MVKKAPLPSLACRYTPVEYSTASEQSVHALTVAVAWRQRLYSGLGVAALEVGEALLDVVAQTLQIGDFLISGLGRSAAAFAATTARFGGFSHLGHGAAAAAAGRLVSHQGPLYSIVQTVGRPAVRIAFMPPR